MFTQTVEVPEDARNVKFHTGAGKLPARYRHALQNVRQVLGAAIGGP